MAANCNNFVEIDPMLRLMATRTAFVRLTSKCFYLGPAGLAVNPLDLHLVNVGSIPTAPTHGEGRLQPHPGDVLKSTPKVRKSRRSGLNLERRSEQSTIFFEICVWIR